VDFSSHPINQSFDAAAKLDLYRQMVRIRVFEQAALKRYQWGDIGGWLNLSIGQESIAAAVRSLMGPDDHSISGSRGIGQAIAAGMEMGPCLAELMGKTNGCSQGKGGMFSFYQPSRHHWGCHGLAAAQTPLAAGLAFALKQLGVNGAVVCFMGDGAVNQGVYHESLNLAGLFGLPVIYIIENNGFAMGTSVARSSRFTECLARRAETYGIEWDHFEDSDPYEIRAKTWTAIERARVESRPTVLEIATYRYYGASVADANHKRYRSAEEIEERKANHDPLTLWRLRLIEETILDSASVERIREHAIAEAQQAVHFATQGIAPGIPQISEHVYWETDHKTTRAKTGRHFFDE
jgi:pyruvate dehydrogenase E1 component alpha subunit